MTPIRIQRKRTKGWKMPESTKYLGRPGIHGNVVKVGEIDTKTGKPHTNESAVELFRWRLAALVNSFGKDAFIEKYIKPLLPYKHFSCFCSLDKPCHVDVWIEYVEKYRNEAAE